MEIPVIENVPMKDLKWFRENAKLAIKKQEDGTITQSEALEFDEEWWNKLCSVGLNKTMDEVLESGITERQFRDFMAEVYLFLSQIGTIEEAKRFVLYAVESQNSEQKA